MRSSPSESAGGLGCPTWPTPGTRTTRPAWPTRPELVTWTEALDLPVLPRRPGRFNRESSRPAAATPHTGGRPPDLHGADNGLVYRAGWALLNRDDPTRLLARSEPAPLEPVTDWEKVGGSQRGVSRGIGHRAWTLARVLRRRGQVRRRRLGSRSRSPLVEHAQIFKAAAVGRARRHGR